MKTVSQYSSLKKWDAKACKYFLFHAVRAIGLAVELGHKAAYDIGRGNVSKDDLAQVTVVGDLQLFVDGEWQEAGRCRLNLRPQDIDLAYTVFLKQRRWLDDLGYNVYQVDLKKRNLCVLDLLGDLAEAASRILLVTGKLWVELKVFNESSYASSLDKEQKKLKALLPRLRARSPEIQTVMLLSCKVEKFMGGTFGSPRLAAQILTEHGEWKDVMARHAKVERGNAPSPKMDLVGVFAQMTWHSPRDARGQIVQGAKVALFSHFLQAFEACQGQCRQKSWNLQWQACQDLRFHWPPEDHEAVKAGIKAICGNQKGFQEVAPDAVIASGKVSPLPKKQSETLGLDPLDPKFLASALSGPFGPKIFSKHLVWTLWVQNF